MIHPTTIAEAGALLQSGHPHNVTTFSICTAFSFEVDGRAYRLVELKGHYLALEKNDIPRRTLDKIEK